jgi:hypothetical protein
MSLVRVICEHFVRPVDQPAGSPPGPRRPESARRRGRHLSFVSPGEDPDRACADIVARTPAGVALLCGPADAAVVGAALGLLLVREQRAPVVVCVWTGAHRLRATWRAPALPAARRLGGRLCSREHDAHAAGRLVIVRLAEDPDDAAAGAGRVMAGAGTAPTVLALGGPRVGSFDALLAEQDLVVVAPRSDSDPVLARLAVDGLAASAVCACACEVPPAPPARALAAAGVMLLPSARRALAGPIGAMA